MKRGAKRLNIRHGHGPRRGCNAVEKAIETVTRREGKREAQRPHPLACSCADCRAQHLAVCEGCAQGGLARHPEDS